MKHLQRWIHWRLEDRPGEPKPAKVPFDYQAGKRIDPHDPAGWMTHGDATATDRPLGFVFVETDGYFFLDIDACLVDGAWTDYAVRLVNRFDGALVETSHSGDGLHVVGRYSGICPAHGTRNRETHSELYTDRRFMAIGSQQRGDPETDCTSALAVLAAQYFPALDPGTPSAWTSGPREDWTGPTDDDELIRKACASGGTAARFGKTASFAQLWTADEAALEEAFPHPGRPWNGNEADAALARHLAFWTGCDCDRIERLMRQSGLLREKWDIHGSYMQLTVLFAVGKTTNVYDRVAPETNEAERPGYQFMALPDQAKLFAGHIYVTSRNRVMNPRGQLLNQQQFNAVVPTHDFARDVAGQVTTRKPWEAFTESMGFNCPIADEPCFDPTTGWESVIERGGVTYANTYREIETPRKPGDASRFLGQLSKLLPNELDQRIMLAYMAAVVQHKGVKFQWCPLVQGVEGNGKTLLTSVLFAAIGDRYSHTPRAHDLDSKFNSWLMGKIIVGIEDIYVPSGRQEVLEVLKPMISNSSAGIRAMNADEETAQICCNFMINSNHRDAIAKTENDRRFAVFFTAQQCAADLARDGMDGDYFPSIYKWLRSDGFAIVHDFLATYAIPDELNPALGHRAPRTSTHVETIAAGLSPLAQEISDIIAEGRPGYRSNWVSRTMLKRDLDRGRGSVRTHQKILEQLGYIRHPALKDRTNNAVSPDGVRADLYVVAGSLEAQIESATVVAERYERAQATGGLDDHGKTQVQ